MTYLPESGRAEQIPYEWAITNQHCTCAIWHLRQGVWFAIWAM